MARRDARVLIVGAGTAGLAAAAELARRGESVRIVEASERVGGTLHVSWAHLSAAGTSLQQARRIDDSPDQHFADVMRISGGTADPLLVRRAVDEAPHTLEWLLDNGFDVAPECPTLHFYHEPYTKPRTYWGQRAGRSVLDVLERVRRRGWADRQSLELRTRLIGLDADGAEITGVRVMTAEGPEVRTLSPEVVILATGGYAGDPALFSELTDGHSVISTAPPTSDGSGILAARNVGAEIRGSELYIPTFGGVEDHEQPGRAIPLDDFPQLTPHERPPWEIYVDSDGRRFVAEDEPSIDVKEHSLLGLTPPRFWIVFDEQVRHLAPPLFPTWSDERLDAAWSGPDPSFVSAGSVAGLAEACGFDRAAFADTVESYNATVRGQQEDPFDRRHAPREIDEAPFYAVRNHAVALKSPAGLHVDGDLRVIERSGQPFANLYAIGEAIGGSALSGRSFVGGMSVTPALSFGRQLGRSL